ncbi:unnamed protein product, partial [Rotaria magnacalcarata]
ESTTTEELQYKVIRPTTGQPYLTEPVMMINSSFSESQEVLNSYARN